MTNEEKKIILAAYLKVSPNQLQIKGSSINEYFVFKDNRFSHNCYLCFTYDELPEEYVNYKWIEYGDVFIAVF